MTIHYPSGQGPRSVADLSKDIPAPHQSIYAKRGMSLEKEINESNKYYLATHQAVVHKKPTPIQLVKVDYPKRSAAVVREAYFRRPSTTDYNGVYKGYYLDFDAKETRNRRSFPLKNFHQHQINHLHECLKQGGICFAFIKFTELDEVYLLPASFLYKRWQEKLADKAASISLEDIRKQGVRVHYSLNPHLKYLPAVDQLIANRSKGVKHE